MAEAKRDGNYVTTLLAVSNVDGLTPVALYADPVTHRLLVSATSGGFDDLTDVTITSAAQGDIIYYNGTAWVNLAAGTNGHFLKTQGASANPTWAALVMTAGGSDTQVQFNDGGTTLAGDAGFVYNKTTDTATLAGNLQCEDLLLEDSDASHYLTITTTSNLTATRTLTLVPGDASRSITMAGNINIAADFITSGANSLTLTTTGSTNVTLPTTGTLATLAGTENLSAKTLVSPTITTSPTATGATWGDLGTVTTADINGGTIDGVTIGGASAGAITGTTITVNTNLVPDANDGAGLGVSGTAFSDLFLASGAVIDFAAGNASLTHSSAKLTMTGAFTITGTTTLATSLTGVLRADSGVVSVDTDVTDIVAAASESAAGKVELATAAETTTGTDGTRAIHPDGLAGSDYGKRVVGILAVDPATNTATGDGKAFFRVPSVMNGWNLVGVAMSVFTAGTTNTTDVQIRNVTDSQDMLSTKLTIDSTEVDTSTAATPAVINTSFDDVATGDRIAIDVDAVSTTPAKGLYIELIFQLP